MTVSELIERLQEADEAGMGDATVLLATQPNYPLQAHVNGIAYRDPEDVPDEDDPEAEESPAKKILYIVEGSQPYDAPYAPKWAFEKAY